MNNLKKHLALISILALLGGCAANEQTPDDAQPDDAAQGVEPTVISVETAGHNGPIKLDVTFDETSITAVTIVEHTETEGLSDQAINELPQYIVDAQSADIDMISGATVTSAAILNGVKEAIATSGITLTPIEIEQPETEEAAVLEWTAQPKLGITKGDYYAVEERFRQGHMGIVEVVVLEDEIVKVEFNETTRPNYYNRFYQDVPKRMSEYNFTMGEKKGAAWIQSVVLVEAQMLEEQRLSGEFDVVAGASNSIHQSMVPLALEIEAMMGEPSTKQFYSIAEDFGNGITGELRLIIEDGKIISCKYDEIFADNKDDIEDPTLQKYYRQSKYQSVLYDEPSRIGFNVQMDALNEKVVATQDLMDLTDLPAIEATGDYGTSGYTERNTAWDNYLSLADKLLVEMQADSVIY